MDVLPGGCFRSANLRREDPETGHRLSIHPQRHQQFEVPHPTEIKSIPEVQSFGLSHRIHSITRTHLKDAGLQGGQTFLAGPPTMKPQPRLLATQDHQGVAAGQGVSMPAASATDEHLAFDPSVEYSFHFIVRRIDLGTSRLVGLPSLFDLRLDGYLNGQPLRLMCVWHPQHPKAPEFSMDDAVPLWDVEVWTEKEWQEQQAVAPESPELG